MPRSSTAKPWPGTRSWPSSSRRWNCCRASPGPAPWRAKSPPAAAQATGLAAGTPVITGTADAAAEAISAGLAQVGDMMVMYGSSIFFILKTDRLVPEPALLAHPLPGAGDLRRGRRDVHRGQPDPLVPRHVGPAGAGGRSRRAAPTPMLRWRSWRLGRRRGPMACSCSPTLPASARPSTTPTRAASSAVSPSATPGATSTARCWRRWATAFATTWTPCATEGITPRRILAVGGGTQNRLWMEMVSSIAGIEQHIPRQQIGAAYGDAILAAVGVGFFADTTAGARWVEQATVIRPEPALQAIYARVLSPLPCALPGHCADPARAERAAAGWPRWG